MVSTRQSCGAHSPEGRSAGTRGRGQGNRASSPGSYRTHSIVRPHQEAVHNNIYCVEEIAGHGGQARGMAHARGMVGRLHAGSGAAQRVPVRTPPSRRSAGVPQCALPLGVAPEHKELVNRGATTQRFVARRSSIARTGDGCCGMYAPVGVAARGVAVASAGVGGVRVSSERVAREGRRDVGACPGTRSVLAGAVGPSVGLPGLWCRGPHASRTAGGRACLARGGL